MNTSDFDLNLLPVFEALFHERNVTRAGLRLGLTQATMSNALRRMRAACGDPLFVRVRGVMEPTPYAECLAQSLVPAVRLIREGLAQPNAFDPGSSDRVFTLLMSDIVQHRVLPELSAHLRDLSPNVEIKVSEAPREGFMQELESGRADLAIGHLQELQVGFYQQRLFVDRHICLAGRLFNGAVGSQLTMAEYLGARHLVVSSSRTDALIDKLLAAQGLARRVAMRVPNYLVIAEIMHRTDLLVTMSTSSASSICGAGYAQSALPVALPGINVRQFWHARFHEDPANQWLRQRIVGLDLRRRGRTSGRG